MKKIILFCALLFSTQAHSFMMLQLNLQQLTDLSEKIFVGQCVSIHPQTDANGRHILEVTYQVSEMLKGSPETQVTFYQMSPDYAQEALERRGVRYSSLDIPLPSYEVGAENMIFLGEEGSAGLTSPIGMGQGKFVIKRSPAGEKTVVNEMQNNHLFKDLKKSPTMKSLSLTGKEKLLLMRSSGEVSLDEISGLVRKIVSKK